MHTDDKLSERIIKNCPGFCAALSQDEIATFISLTTVETGEPQEIMAELGDVGHHFFLVTHGALKLVKEEVGQEIEIGHLDAGHLAGVMSFFDHKPRSIRLRATKKGVQMLSISRSMYNRLSVEHPHIAINLLEFIILSLDGLVRDTSNDVSTLYKQISGIGYR